MMLKRKLNLYLLDSNDDNKLSKARDLFRTCKIRNWEEDTITLCGVPHLKSVGIMSARKTIMDYLNDGESVAVLTDFNDNTVMDAYTKLGNALKANVQRIYG